MSVVAIVVIVLVGAIALVGCLGVFGAGFWFLRDVPAGRAGGPQRVVFEEKAETIEAVPAEIPADQPLQEKASQQP